MRQYLAEGIEGGFTFLVDRTKPFVTESRPGGTFSRIPGRLSVCDCINGNNRRYRKQVWEKNLSPGSPLQESIKLHAAFGLLEHPSDGKISLLSPICHHVTKAELVEAKDQTGKTVYEVHGEIEIYETEEGKKLKALIEGGYNPTVSSRGYGSLTKAPDGVDEVDDDYVCESWDVVIKPSFATATLTPNRAAAPEKSFAEAQVVPPGPALVDLDREFEVCLSAYQRQSGGTVVRLPGSVALVKDGRVVEHRGPRNTTPPPQDVEELRNFVGGNNFAESQKTNGTVRVVQERQQSTPKAPLPSPGAPASPKPPVTENTMNLTEIKSRLAALRGINPASNPQRFAESMSEVDSLHTTIDRFISEDAATRNYTGTTLHRQLDGIVGRWNESAVAPAKQAKRLQENNLKLMKVVHATAKTGLTYKKHLGEAVVKVQKGERLIEELTKRGQGWREVAETRKTKLQTATGQFDTACEALDIMTERYHKDTVELARRVIVLEFAEKAQTPEIQKALKEANRLRHIAAIRETLEGKPAAAAPGKTNETISAKPADQGAPVNEGKKPAPAAPAAAPATAPVVAEAKVTLTSSVRDPRDLNESIEMVRRMSVATAK